MPDAANPPKLSLKQRRFISAYLGVAQGNATEAARAAGYQGGNNSLAVAGNRALKHPAVQAALDEAREQLRLEGIGVKQNRIDRADERHRHMQRVIEERASAYAGSGVPGAATGLLVRQQRTLGAGANATVIDEYVLDAALLREMREIEKQIAIEVGDWTQNLNLAAVVTFADLASIAQTVDESEGGV